MRSLACPVVLLASLLLVPGCAIFKKNTDSKTPATATGGGAAPAKFPTSTDPLLNGGNASGAYGGAVLAGRVIDNHSKPPANTSIRLVNVDGKDTGNPTDVTVTPDGYFTIQGLKAGASYRLLARGKNGDHVLAGITQTWAPNLTVVIQVKEDFATAGTTAFDDKDQKTASGLDSLNNFASGNSTVPTTSPGGARGGSDFELPAAVSIPAPGQAPLPPIPTSQNWVPGPNLAADKGNIWPPPLDIPNPTIKPPPPPLLIPKTAPAPPSVASLPGSFPGDSLLSGPARVPSCVFLGKKLSNFALNDLNGEPWEFKRNRKGKLVLIDFWSTSCTPCLYTIPHLIQLQNQYGPRGLEVLGIAVESGRPPQELAFLVDSKARKLGINYRQLLSSSAGCPVCSEFNVDGLPTMVLVDQEGNVLWRHKGMIDRYALDALQNLIRHRLNAR